MVAWQAGQIKDRVWRLGREITTYYRSLVSETSPLVVFGVLKGGAVFTADLIREIDLPLELDFIRAQSYGNEKKSSGEVILSAPWLHTRIHERHVLVVDDIMDTGRTLSAIFASVPNLEKDHVLSLAGVVLFKKPHAIDLQWPVTAGFEVAEDAFLVGYGMGEGEKNRNKRHIEDITRTHAGVH